MFEQAPIGKAIAKIGGNDVEVGWVQLWKDGPRFATYNIGVTNGDDTNSGGRYLWIQNVVTTNWGSNWRMPTKDEMEELYKATCNDESIRASAKVTCEYTSYLGKYGFLFKGVGDYKDYFIFIPPTSSSSSSAGFMDIWTSTEKQGSNPKLIYYLHISYSSNGWQSDWLSNGSGSEFYIRPVLNQ